MLARLSAADYPALRALSTRDDSDPTIALLDAAAVLADVLTFYQERIANESFLRTATQWRSLAGIARLTGYEPSHGLAATAYLAFTLESAAGAPETTLIPAGTRVQSVPAAGQLPQTFETSADFEARPEWNAMSALRALPPPAPTAATTSIFVQGVATQVRAGDRLLLLDAQGDTFIVTAVAIIPDAPSQTTRIDLTPGAPVPAVSVVPPPVVVAIPFTRRLPLTTLALHTAIFAQAWDGADLLAQARSLRWSLRQVMDGVRAAAAAQANTGAAVIRFRQRAAAFGNNAPAWDTLPANLRTGAAPLALVSGTVEGSAVANATVTNVSLVNAVVTGAVVPLGLPSVTDLPLSGGVVVGTVTPADPSIPYATNWDATGTTLNFAWANNLLSPGPGGPGFGQNTVVQLDRSYSGIAPSGWVLLEDGGTALPGTVAAVGDTSAVAFTLSAKVTQIDLGSSLNLSAFTRRGTTIWCDSETITLAPIPIADDVAGNVLALDQIYLGLAQGQTIAVTGTRTDLAGVPATELATIAKVVVQGNATWLILVRPLANTYARATVAVNANVVVATHGMSVTETLGSGDASQAFQQFALRQPPLTYVADPTTAGPATTLTILVNGEAWTEVPTLFSAGPHDRVYATWLDEANATHVLFGDGITGARLPTAAANIVAFYRTGIGSPGLVAAAAVSLLITRPIGVRNVANPVATADAADAETPAMLRGRAPLHVLTLDRIVSLDDYANYARAYPGISKALASWFWTQRGRGVSVTVAGQAGASIDPASPLACSLVAAIAARSDPTVPVTLADYQPVYIELAAAIAADPALVANTVYADIETALRAAFALDQRDFGQPLLASEIVAIIQQVPGVVACNLTQLSRPPQQAGVAATITAAIPTPGAAAQTQAEILLLDPRPIPFTVMP
jgi:predicted phage baseplate assembly protein